MNILMNILRIIDEIEQLVEEGKGILGKRLIEEEAFFTKIQQLRSALPQAMKDAENAGATRHLGNDASASLQAVAANARGLSTAEKLSLIAQLSADLARQHQ